MYVSFSVMEQIIVKMLKISYNFIVSDFIIVTFLLVNCSYLKTLTLSFQFIDVIRD